MWDSWEQSSHSSDNRVLLLCKICHHSFFICLFTSNWKIWFYKNRLVIDSKEVILKKKTWLPRSDWKSELESFQFSGTIHILLPWHFSIFTVHTSAQPAVCHLAVPELWLHAGWPNGRGTQAWGTAWQKPQPGAADRRCEPLSLGPGEGSS